MRERMKYPEDQRNLQEIIDLEHNRMPGNPDYIDFLKAVIPGYDNDFYFNLSYAGTYGSEAYESLSADRQYELSAFYRKHNIYHEQ